MGSETRELSTKDVECLRKQADWIRRVCFTWVADKSSRGQLPDLCNTPDDAKYCMTQSFACGRLIIDADSLVHPTNRIP